MARTTNNNYDNDYFNIITTVILITIIVIKKCTVQSIVKRLYGSFVTVIMLNTMGMLMLKQQHQKPSRPGDGPSSICTRRYSALDTRLSVREQSEWMMTDCYMPVRQTGNMRSPKID